MHTKSMPLSAEQAHRILFDIEERICDLARDAMAARIIVLQFNGLIADLAKNGMVLLDMCYDERLLAADFVERMEEQAKELRSAYYQAFDEVVALAKAEQKQPPRATRKPANDVQPRGVLQ